MATEAETLLAEESWYGGTESELQITYRVLATGEVQMRYGADQPWHALLSSAVVELSRSSSFRECRWYQSLPAHIRQVIREHYRLVTVSSYPCAGRKHGCGATVTTKGAYCRSCAHDEFDN